MKDFFVNTSKKGRCFGIYSVQNFWVVKVFESTPIDALPEKRNNLMQFHNKKKNADGI